MTFLLILICPEVVSWSCYDGVMLWVPFPVMPSRDVGAGVVLSLSESFSDARRSQVCSFGSCL